MSLFISQYLVTAQLQLTSPTYLFELPSLCHGRMLSLLGLHLFSYLIYHALFFPFISPSVSPTSPSATLLHHSSVPLFLWAAGLQGACYPAPFQTFLGWEARHAAVQLDWQKNAREEERVTTGQLPQQDWQAGGIKEAKQEQGKCLKGLQDGRVYKKAVSRKM